MSRKMTSQARQSIFHMPLSDLSTHIQLVSQDLANYAHSVTHAFNSGARVADSFYELFKNSQFAGIARHYSEISQELSRAAQGYVDGLTRDITKDGATILAKVKKDDKLGRHDNEIKSVAEIFHTFLEMQAQLYTSAFEVMSIFAKANNNLEDLSDQESKQEIIQEYTTQSLEKLRLPVSNTTSMAIQTDPIHKQPSKGSQFFNKLSNKNTTNDNTPKSFFYCDLPDPDGGASTTEQMANVGQDSSNQLVPMATHDNSKQHVPMATDNKQHIPMVTQQELDTVINLLAGPKRVSRKMQTIPELLSPDGPPKPFIAAPGRIHRTQDVTGYSQFSTTGQPPLQSISYMGYPVQPQARGYAMNTDNQQVPRVNIQAATPPGNIGAQEMTHFPRLYRTDAMNTTPEMYGPPMNPQAEAEFAQYVASIGALTSGPGNFRKSNENEESLNKSWPCSNNKGWPHVRDDTTSSESDSDGEQLLALGMGIVNAIATDKRRHSSDDTAVPIVAPVLDVAEQRHLASRSAEDLSRGYTSSKTWPPKQLWNNRHILPDHMLSMGTNEIFGGNAIYQPVPWSTQHPLVPQQTWFTPGQTLAPDYLQQRTAAMNYTAQKENRK